MRDQAYWERWLRQRPKALEEARASVKEWYREAGVEKGERRAFKAALKALNPDGVKGKREKKPPRRGKGRIDGEGTPYGAPRDRRGADGGRTVEGRLRFTREGRPIVIPVDPETPIVRIPGHSLSGAWPKDRVLVRIDRRRARRPVVWAGRADPRAGDPDVRRPVRAGGQPPFRPVPRPGVRPAPRGGPPGGFLGGTRGPCPRGGHRIPERGEGGAGRRRPRPREVAHDGDPLPRGDLRDGPPRRLPGSRAGGGGGRPAGGPSFRPRRRRVPWGRGAPAGRPEGSSVRHDRRGGCPGLRRRRLPCPGGGRFPPVRRDRRCLPLRRAGVASRPGGVPARHQRLLPRSLHSHAAARTLGRGVQPEVRGEPPDDDGRNSDPAGGEAGDPVLPPLRHPEPRAPDLRRGPLLSRDRYPRSGRREARRREDHPGDRADAASTWRRRRED